MKLVSRFTWVLAVVGVSASLAAPARGQDKPPEPVPVPGQPQSELERLKQKVDDLSNKVDTIKKDADAQKADDAARIDELEKALNSVKDAADGLRLGTTKYLVTGNATVGFNYVNPTRRATSNSTAGFNAGMEIDFLWAWNDKAVFEGGASFGIAGSGDNAATSVDLALCDVSYFVCDNMAIRGGLMPTAFSRYKETLDAPWIDKLPDAPLFTGDGFNGNNPSIVPDTMVGVEARGAMPVSTMKVLYALYTINNPVLNVTDPQKAGQVSFSNFDGFDNIPGFGGKIGFLPIPEIEIGTALMWSRVSARGTTQSDIDMTMFNLYARTQFTVGPGNFDLQVEWDFQHVHKATYDRDGSLGFGPVRFRNERQGGYVQVAYRLSGVDHEIVKNVEFVARCDWFNNPKNAPINDNTIRGCWGVNYWFTPSIVLKVAYELTEVYNHGAPDQEVHGLLTQLALGF